MFAHIELEIDPPAFSRVFAELSGASYIHSTTIGTFIKLKKILERDNGRLFTALKTQTVGQFGGSWDS